MLRHRIFEVLASNSAGSPIGVERSVRTTVDIDEDVLLAARELARRRGTSMGQVLSDLARQALSAGGGATVRDGVPLFPVAPGAGIVTPELVNRLRDEAP
jgi:hypothetical protein